MTKNEKRQKSGFAKAVPDLNIIANHRLCDSAGQINFGLKLLLLP